VLCAALLLAAAAPASAQWRPVVRSCASDGAAAGCTAVGSAFAGAWNVAITPNGKQAYAAAWSTDRVTGFVRVFDRNATTGALTLRSGMGGCYASGMAVGGCTGANGLERADEILFDSNATHVYVTGWGDGPGRPASIAWFTRNLTTGALTQGGCLAEDTSTGCTAATGVGGRGAVISRDQKNIYVIGASSLAVFNRNLTTGALTFAACFGPPPCTGLTDGVLPVGTQIALSADDAFLYVPSQSSDGVLVFSRDPGTGAISQLAGGFGCITRTGNPGACAAQAQIPGSTASTLLSPNGRQLYVAGGPGLAVFARNPTNGRLTFQSCMNDLGNLGCTNGFNVAGTDYTAVSPDGLDLILNHSTADGGLSIVPRTSTGNLVRRSDVDSCITRDGRAFDQGVFVSGRCRVSAAVAAEGHVKFFGNQHIYAGGWPDGRITAFKRDYYPVCTSRSVTVPRNTATAIPLTCSDRNGDAITRTIVQTPAAGTLGSINQASGNVFYDPFSNFAGSDRFTFRGTAAGLVSAPATIAVTVPRPPRKPPKPVKVEVGFRYLGYSDKTVFKKLQVKKVPRGARLRATCAFRGHKCPGKAARAFTKKRARGTVSLASRFVDVELPIGAKITIVVTKPRAIGAVKILTMRPRLEPKVTTRCLRPGAKKPKKRC
jgi:Big-like domain-containing protein